MYLLPYPKQVKTGKPVFFLSPHTVIAKQAGVPLIAAQQLQAEIRRFAGVEVAILQGVGREGDIVLSLDSICNAQAYTLAVSKKGVQVAGGSEKGILHGVQTLRQIIRQSGLCLPEVQIADEPDFSERAYYFDVSRGRVSTLDTLKMLADEMCFYKMNQLQLYVEHTYLFRDLSETWRGGTPLTAEEIMVLDAYCMERGIELVPSLSSFGHMFEILKTKTYEHLCELEDPANQPLFYGRMAHHTINPAMPESLEFVKALLDEFMPLFKSKQFNICCDETFDLGKGRGAEAMKAVGEKAFYINFVKALCDHVIKSGRIPMMWGDIIVKFPEAISEMPEETIFLNWGYAPDIKEDETRIFAEAGVKQYVCPGVSSWNHWVPNLQVGYENISRMCAYGHKYGALGVLNTDWGDFGHVADPAFSLPGVIYGAAFSWNANILPAKEVDASISHLAYLDRSGTAVESLKKISEVEAFGWWHLVRFKESGIALQKIDSKRLAEKQAIYKECFRSLAACIAGMDTVKRIEAQKWLLGLEALHLWNRVGAKMLSCQTDAALASELEKWFFLYCESWRKGAKEGDLGRVGEIVFFYADKLRG